jgi:hypothetical protein
MDVGEIRRSRLRHLINEYGGQLPLAKAIGQFGASYLTQLAGPNPTRAVSEKFARKVERALSLPTGWMDRDHDVPPGVAEDVAAYSAGWRSVADAVAAVLGRLAARRVNLSPTQVAALVDVAYAHGDDPAFLDRLIRLVEALQPAER